MKEYEKMSVNQITEMEIAKIENNNKIQKLELQLRRAANEIELYKGKEKSAVRAILLYERKLNYLKNELKLRIQNIISTLGVQGVYDNKTASKVVEQLENLLVFIGNETHTSREEKSIVTASNESLDKRFEILKAQFAEKVGTSVARGRGRPTKDQQSITADIGIGGNKSKQKSEHKKNQQKLDEIFFSSSKDGNGVKSSIPQTEDSIFDFDEALNPNLSLSDIMNDIENERKDLVEKKKMTQIQMLEAGYINKPKIRK